MMGIWDDGAIDVTFRSRIKQLLLKYHVDKHASKPRHEQDWYEAATKLIINPT
jgi:preprotein translocase subunit Sec63